MGAIAETFDDRFIVACHHSMQANPYDNMDEIVGKLGAVRTKQLNMGGSSNADVNSMANLNIGQDNLTCAGIITSTSDERTPEEKLKLEIAHAFGSEVAQMADFITQVMQSLGPDSQLSKAQKEQLFDMVSEIITLKNLTNTGALPGGQDRLDALIASTTNKIADLLLDGLNQKMVSPAITEFVHQMLADVGAQYDIPELTDKMVKIEGRINPESYLQDSIAEMVLQLSELMESQNLSDEAKAEIEALIEKMELAAKNGEPLPRDVIKALDNLGETFPDIHLPQTFADSLDTLKDTNIVMKAETLGISIDQVQSIETAIETLETQLQELNEEDRQLEDSILEIIEKLTAFADEGGPLNSEAIQSLEAIVENFPDINIDSSIMPVSRPDNVSTASIIDFPSVEQKPSISSILAGALATPVIGSSNNDAPIKINAQISDSKAPDLAEIGKISPVPQKPSNDPSKSEAREIKSDGQKFDPPIIVTDNVTPDIINKNPDPITPEIIDDIEPSNEIEFKDPDVDGDEDTAPRQDPEEIDNVTPDDSNPDGPPEINRGGNDLENPTDRQDKPEVSVPEKPCTCQKVFQKVSNPQSTLAELKESIKQQVGQDNITDKQINDTLINNLDELTETQKNALILDIAKDDFTGDTAKAKEHIQAVSELNKIENANHQQRIEAEQTRSEALKQLFESDKPDSDGKPKDEFNPKGCPEHGDGPCPEGAHSHQKAGVEITQRQTPDKPSRRRGLKR